jgi:tetratricopeptide (TPR) repeat protein
MKKALVAVVLALAIVVTAQQPTQPGQQPGANTSPGQQPGANTPPSQKVIKDPAEYDAYIKALNTPDPAAKGAAMEAFVKQYPQSVVLTDALIEARAAYQKAGNQAKVEEIARRILQLTPNDVTSLAIITFMDRAKAASGDQAALKEACTDTQTGLEQLPNWKKPDGVSDADFAGMRKETENIFDGAAGFCALQKKDYTNARTYYLKALESNPNDLTNNYQLAIAYLETDPIDLRGFWYGAKAIALAGNNAATVNAISPYIKAKYKKYHGKAEDWDQFAASVASQTAPPSPEELAKVITPAPTPCDFAVQAARDNPPDQLSFSDKEFILSKAGCSPANKDAADKIWQSIQTMEKNGEARLEIPIKVIAATKDTVDAAVSDDNQAANKADLHVQLEKPTLKPPAPGTMTKIIGVITNYMPEPFMFTMEKGALPEPKTPAHRAPARKKKK